MRHATSPLTRIALFAAAAVTLSGCLSLEGEPPPLEIPGTPNEDEPLTAGELGLPEDFAIDTLADGLDFPTSIAWDDEGTPYVALSGFVYGGEERYPAAILRVEDNGATTVVAEGFDPPITDITWHEGLLYVSERGRVTRLDPADDWARTPIITGLPSFGDHHNNEVLFSPDGRLFVLQGTATNSAVVGLDNPDLWVVNITEGSDVPCEDVTLAGVNYRTPNPFLGRFPRPTSEIVVYESREAIPPGAAGAEGEEVVTGAYVPFGTPTYRGQTLEGRVPCNGAILTAAPDGSGLDWYAWGFRNPYGAKFDAEGNLWVTDTGYDQRGSRPVYASADHFWRVEEGRWYGWPDYEAGISLAEPQYALIGEAANPAPVLLEPPASARGVEAHAHGHTGGPVPAPPLNLSTHATATKFDLSPGGAWGPEGTVYLAQFGDLTPGRGLRGENAGHAVVRFPLDDPASREVDVFLTGASRFDPRFRPIEAAFGPDDDLYVVNFGKVEIESLLEGPDPAPVPGTGAVYRINPGALVQVPEAGPEGVREEPPETRTPAPSALVPLAVAALLLARRRWRP